YRTWRDRIADELAAAGDGAILVGHSIGASVLIKAFVEGSLKQPVAGLFLVAAPFWHDDQVWRWKEAELTSDAADRIPRGVQVFLYHGRDDEIVPFAHLQMYAAALPQATVRGLAGRDHQLNNDLSE